MERTVIRTLRANPALAVFALLNTAFVPVALVGLLVDDRIVTDSPLWFKPLKFALSLALYSVSLAWALSLTTRLRRFTRWAGTLAAAGGTVEMAIIVGQAARGRRSHFNTATELDSTLYAVMGATITAVWVVHALVVLALLFSRFEDRTTAVALRFGMGVALAGMAVGFLMTSPAEGQDPALGLVGAHTVGAPDGGPHLPLTGWSTTGGDLRVSHFIGMHALQALPLAMALLPRLASPRLARDLGLAWAGLTALTLWQALRGQPPLRPDALTLAGLAALLAWTGWALWRADRERARRAAVEPARDAAAVAA
ncbi:hypothetical protein [Actinosynnema sp.]|uniref:hypothetical protein n=1 Tax=Actinosynnema sp. TaxID=1872144 RepID=UPI003F8319A4